jgi:hypothetical protein
MCRDSHYNEHCHCELSPLYRGISPIQIYLPLYRFISPYTELSPLYRFISPIQIYLPLYSSVQTIAMQLKLKRFLFNTKTVEDVCLTAALYLIAVRRTSLLYTYKFKCWCMGLTFGVVNQNFRLTVH